MPGRILFHAINHVGLGHLNRLLAIAEYLREGCALKQCLFLIEGGRDLIQSTDLPWIQIPAFGDFRSERWLKWFGISECEKYPEGITRAVAQIFGPDIVVLDTVLYKPVVAGIAGTSAKVVLVGRIGDLLRRQLDSGIPEFDRLDLVLVPQEEAEISITDRQRLRKIKCRVVYTGPIVRDRGGDPQQLRRTLGLSESDPLIVLTLGGGGWNFAERLLMSVIEARGLILHKVPTCKLVILCGPHFTGSLPKTDDFVLYVSQFEPNVGAFLRAASVVVCMCGYNTMNEVVLAEVPTICVPAPEADDQLARASDYERRFPRITTGCLDPIVLANQISALLMEPRRVSESAVPTDQRTKTRQLVCAEFSRLQTGDV